MGITGLRASPTPAARRSQATSDHLPIHFPPLLHWMHGCISSLTICPSTHRRQESFFPPIDEKCTESFGAALPTGLVFISCLSPKGKLLVKAHLIWAEHVAELQSGPGRGAHISRQPAPGAVPQQEQENGLCQPLRFCDSLLAI